MLISCDDIFFEMYTAISIALLGVMMDIQYVSFYLLPADSGFWKCGKPCHDGYSICEFLLISGG